MREIGITGKILKQEGFDALGLLEKAGIPYLEIEPADALWGLRTEKAFRGYLRACEKYSVRTLSIHGYSYTNSGAHVADRDPASRKKCLELNKKLIKRAGQLKARHVVMHLWTEKFERSDDESLQVALDALKALLPSAEKAGVKIAVENLSKKWLIKHINALIDEIRHPLVGICFDVGHSNRHASVGTELPQCRGRLIALHIHDNFGTKDTHLLPFLGNIDWKLFAELLVKTGYRGPLMYESVLREGETDIPGFLLELKKAHRRITSGQFFHL